MKEIKVTVRDLVELLPTKTQVVVFSGDTVVYSGDALSLSNSQEFQDTEVHMVKIPDKKKLWIIL
ncbi:MAG: hypothetical protein M0Q87_15180 [Ottowia sp.]|nr:hypothetical protein [Ottowia sp.]